MADKDLCRQSVERGSGRRRESKVHKGRVLYVFPKDWGVGQRFYTLSNGEEWGG